MASNNDHVISAGLQERRFVVLDVGTKKMQNHRYFERLIDQMDNGGREALLYHLQNYDLSQVNLRKIPKTDALNEMKIYSMTPLQRFWYGRLKNGYIRDGESWPIWIGTDELFSIYCYDAGIDHNRSSETSFGMGLQKLLPYSKTSRRKANDGRQKNGYELPCLEECRKFFDKITQAQNHWG